MLNDNDPVIIAVGMIASVGLNAAQCAASVRAGVSRFGPSSFNAGHRGRYTLAMVPREGLPELPPAIANRDYFTRREGLLLRFAAAALKDCAAQLAMKDSFPVWLALPEFETQRPIQKKQFLDDLAAMPGAQVNRAKSRSDWIGRAGGLVAVSEAQTAIRENREQLIVVGGVDTFAEPYILMNDYLYMRGKAETDSEDRFIPGEGAGFIAVTSVATARRLGMKPLLCLGGFGQGAETGHWGNQEPSTGDGLAGAVQQALTGTPELGPITEIYSTMNGESYWAKEWGIAQIRHAKAFAPEARMNHPADCFGDLGAAFGPCLVGLAAIGMSEGYRSAPALVYGSSDLGARAALVLKTTSN